MYCIGTFDLRLKAKFATFNKNVCLSRTIMTFVLNCSTKVVVTDRGVFQGGGGKMGCVPGSEILKGGNRGENWYKEGKCLFL